MIQNPATDPRTVPTTAPDAVARIAAFLGVDRKTVYRWLADEAASLSMFGGSRLLWIEPAGEEDPDHADGRDRQRPVLQVHPGPQLQVAPVSCAGSTSVTVAPGFR